MKRLVGLAVLLTLVNPTDASDPIRARMEKPRPTQSAEPPLALPIPALPGLGAEPTLGARLLEAVVSPQRVVVRLVVDRLFDGPQARMRRLLAESEDL